MTDRIVGEGHRFIADAVYCAACGMTVGEAERWPDISCDAARDAEVGKTSGSDRKILLFDLDNVSAADLAPPTKAETVEAILASVRKDFATEDERLAFMAKTIIDLGAAAGQQRVLWDQERDGLRAFSLAAGMEIKRLQRALSLRDASPLALSNDLFAAHLIWAAAQDDGAERVPGEPTVGFAFRLTPQMRQAGADALAGYAESVADRGAWAERVYQAMARAAIGVLGLIPGKASAKLLGAPTRENKGNA